MKKTFYCREEDYKNALKGYQSGVATIKKEKTQEFNFKLELEDKDTWLTYSRDLLTRV